MFSQALGTKAETASLPAVADGPQLLVPHKRIFAVPPKAHVDMTRRPRLIHVGLRHEGHAHAHALCHLLQALLVHHVPVRHVESV